MVTSGLHPGSYSMSAAVPPAKSHGFVSCRSASAHRRSPTQHWLARYDDPTRDGK